MIQIEQNHVFKECFENANDPAFTRYINIVRIFKGNDRVNSFFRKNRRLPDGFEKMFIVPKEYVKHHPHDDFDAKSNDNTVIIDHGHYLSSNLELLAYFNKRDDEVQLDILRKLKRMIYWKVQNRTNTMDVRSLNMLYLKIKSFSRLNQNDFDLFQNIMKGHYNERMLHLGNSTL